LNTYIPKYQQDLGASSAVYGLLMSAFMIASAFGGLAGSYLADRVGIRNVLAGSLILGALPLLGFLRTQGIASYALFALSGFFVGPSHTLFIVAGQRQFPTRMAMISGAFLGFTFVSGAGGSWVLGLFADRLGLPTMLGVLPWVLGGAAICGWLGTPHATSKALPQKAE
jgi:MFS family permease